MHYKPQFSDIFFVFHIVVYLTWKVQLKQSLTAYKIEILPSVERFINLKGTQIYNFLLYNQKRKKSFKKIVRKPEVYQFDILLYFDISELPFL